MRLSGPTPELPAAAGATDWFVLIDGTSVGAVSSLMHTRLESFTAPMQATPVSRGIYNLMWDLAKSDIALN